MHATVGASLPQVQSLGGTAAVERIPLGPIPHPEEEEGGPPAGNEGGQLAALTAVLALGRQQQQQREGSQQQQPQQRREELRQPRPAAVLGDEVAVFNEIDAAAGALGRFPGSQVMPLIRQFTGLEPVCHMQA